MNDGEIFERLVLTAAANTKVKKLVLCDFQAYRGALRHERVWLNSHFSLPQLNYTLAHEIAHSFLHYDKGDTIRSERHEEYEEQADRAARMLLCAVAGINDEEVDNYVKS